ncbi:MAG: hypothetical protein JWQ98_1054 [Chlorobi bacterium]|nr:hypothetical protein [Chlorobiota bacterium]
MNDNIQQQADRTDKDVALAAVQIFANIVASRRTARIGRFDAL